MFQVQPSAKGVSQPSPLPISIELGKGVDLPPAGLGDSIKREIRERLLVTSDITLVNYGSMPRETYKSKLVDYSNAI